jgi:hypothetical protein
MWNISVAKEPVLIPDNIFSYHGVTNDIYSEFINAFPNIINEIRKYEYGVVILENFGKLFLLYIDKSCLPNLCGHASIGLVHLFASIFGNNKDFIFNTKAGQIVGKRENETIYIQMPESILHNNLIANKLSFIKNTAIAECGNRFIINEIENINAKNISELQEISINLINQYNVYGVFWFNFININHFIKTQSVTIFGNKGQIDLSPCGTGTSSLAGYLYKTGKLNKNEILNNFSLNNEMFTVQFDKTEPLKSTLSFKSNIEILEKIHFDKYNNQINWKLINIKDFTV